MNQSERRMARTFSVATTIVGLTLLGASVSWAQQKPLKAQLVGAWTMVSQEVTPKGGTKGPGFMGPNPKGVLILDVSGQYAYVAARPDRPKLKTTSPRKDIPAAELGEAVRPFGANFGTWSVNEADKTLIRKREVALISNNDGRELKQTVTLSKGELRLVEVSANTGATIETVYRRAK